jgi:hypothetical protein
MEKIKIRIINEDHCREVQKTLFEQGKNWGDGKGFLYLDSRWIFHGNGTLTYSDNFDWGLKHRNKEVTLQELLYKGEIQYEIY